MNLTARFSEFLDRPISGAAPEARGPEMATKGVTMPKTAARQQLFGWGPENLFAGPGEYPLRGYQGYNYGGEETPAAVYTSILMNVVGWIVILGSQAELRIIDKKTKLDVPEGQPIIDLLAGMAGDTTHFTFLSLMLLLLYGNGHYNTPLDNFGEPTDCKYIPPWNISPEELGGTLRTGTYPTKPLFWRVGADKYLPSEILHLRWGIDPYESRLGFPPARQVLADILTDAQAGGFTSEVLENLGYAANILMPEEQIHPKDADKMADKFAKKFGPGKRGATFIPNIPLRHEFLKADVFDGADLKDLRSICEARMCGGFHILPSVVGFTSGIEQMKVGASMSSSTRTSWRTGVVPPLDFIRRQVKTHFFPLYALDPQKIDAIYDPSAISALQEDPMERRRGLALATAKKPWITIDEARRVEGYDPTGDPKHSKIPEEPKPQPGGEGGGSQ